MAALFQALGIGIVITNLKIKRQEKQVIDSRKRNCILSWVGRAKWQVESPRRYVTWNLLGQCQGPGLWPETWNGLTEAWPARLWPRLTVGRGSGDS